VVNARDVRLTGGKEAKKFAYRHSGYPGGLTATQYARLLAEKPVFAVEKAIKGMLPKNRLGRAMAKKLQVYAGAEHPHAAQKPEPLTLGDVPPWTGLPQPTAAVERTARSTKVEPGPKAPGTKPEAARPAAKKTTATRTTAKTSTSKKPTAKKVTAKATASKATDAKAPRTRRTKKEG